MVRAVEKPSGNDLRCVGRQSDREKFSRGGMNNELLVLPSSGLGTTDIEARYAY